MHASFVFIDPSVINDHLILCLMRQTEMSDHSWDQIIQTYLIAFVRHCAIRLEVFPERHSKEANSSIIRVE